MITTPELYWTAGFLEGEGYFYFNAKTSNGVPRIICAQVQKQPVEVLQQLFGGYLRLDTWAHRQNEQNSPVWRWELSGHKAVALMMTLYALMSPKRKAEIGRALEKWRVKPVKSRKAGYTSIPPSGRILGS